MSQGQPTYPPVYGRPAPPNHPSAVTSLVLGILSIVLCGLFTGIPAMVMGRRAIRGVRASAGRLGGEGLAQGGFWTGLVGTVWSAGATLLVLLILVFGGTLSSSFEQSCTVT